MISETTTCSVCGKQFTYMRFTRPRKRCSYRCELRGGQERRLNGHHSWNAIRGARYSVLKAAGMTPAEADAGSQSRTSFAAALRARGIDPTPHAALMPPPAWPKTGTPKAVARQQRYAALRALGASSLMANAGCQTDGTFERAKRMLEEMNQEAAE
jgi:hypothetical protein